MQLAGPHPNALHAQQSKSQNAYSSNKSRVGGNSLAGAPRELKPITDKKIAIANINSIYSQ